MLHSRLLFHSPDRQMRHLPLLKVGRLLAEFIRAIFILWVLFPRLDRRKRLDHGRRWAQRILLILGIEIQCEGASLPAGASLVVSNHLSWLDILVIQSLMPAVFVAKAEVRGWPLIGWMAHSCATIFVNRSSRVSAREMADSAASLIEQGLSVVAFPEGTSGDGRDLGAFHSNIFESAITTGALVQPVTLTHLHGLTGMPTRATLFIDDMTLMDSLKNVLAMPNIKIQVHLGDCIPSAGHGRKSLAQQAHQSIRDQLLTPARQAAMR